MLRVPSVEPGASAVATAAPIKGAIRRVNLPPGNRLIALTFDLCETAGEVAGYDGAVIDYLRAQNVKATFFCRRQMDAVAQGARPAAVSDPLFEIGTHGWAHRNTRLISGAELAQEIGAPSSAYSAMRSELGAAQCAVRHAEAFS